MAERQRKTKSPCEVCSLHRDLCICAQIPKLELRTRVTLIVHAKELKRTTNTGRLAIHALTNAEMLVRGRMHQPIDLSTLLKDEYETYLLYPSQDAVEIETLDPAKPVHLIVPDGNWRQAAKVGTRHPELSRVPRVRMTAVNTATMHLRREHFAEGFSTLEAIARALGHLEGSSVENALRTLYQAKLNATLKGRGVLI